jgi:plastocyanin
MTVRLNEHSILNVSNVIGEFMNKSVGIIVVIAVVAIIGIGAVVLTGDDNETNNNQTNSTSQSDASSATPANNEEQQEAVENSDVTVDIIGSNFEFSQDEITAKPGDIVTINYSVDGGSHDFVIDELGVQSEVISSSATDTVTFTVPEDAAGQTYAFYCSIGNHRAQGMEGQLVISE